MSELPEFLKSGYRARLIPVVADTSKEVRAVSVLLAALKLVPQFSAALMGTIGQRVGARTEIDCWTEIVPRDSGEPRRIRPDGLVRLRSGRGSEWFALIEAKVGRAEIDEAQISGYADMAKATGVQAVISISNQFVATPAHTPVRLTKVLSRHVSYYHWSWMFVITQAMLVMNEDSFANPLQKYILAELVQYLRHDSVGTARFDRMNKEWKELVTAVNSRRALVKNSPEVEHSVAAWHQECRDLSLMMSRKINRLVRLKLSRAHMDDPAQRLRDDCERLASEHVLQCVLDVPDAASGILVEADLVRRCIAVSMALSAPKDKQRTSSRVNWLLRQLAKSEPTAIHIEASFLGRKAPDVASLEQLRSDPGHFDGRAEGKLPTAFTVVLVRDMAGKFSGSKTFIEELEDIVPGFYERVGQHLQAYVARPPRVKAASEAASDDGPDGGKTADDALIQVAEESAVEAMDEALGYGSSKHEESDGATDSAS
jgi:hypothetical protein